MGGKNERRALKYRGKDFTVTKRLKHLMLGLFLLLRYQPSQVPGRCY